MGYFAHILSNAHILPECRVDYQYFGDIRNIPEDFLKGVDMVVHLAAISNDPIGNAFEDVTKDVNFHATLRLANKAKKVGVKSFVFASSCSIYGSAEDEPRRENSLLAPLTTYAKTKVESEKELRKLSDKSFKVTCLRFATACGMSERLRLDLVLNDFVASAVSSGEIIILSDGTPWRPLIHVKDMARAIDWALHRDANKSGEFLAINTGSNSWNFQIKDLANTVAQIIPDTKISINKTAQPDKRSYKVNFDLFDKLATNHKPIHELHYAIGDLKQGLDSMRFIDHNFRESSFIRLNVLRDMISRGYIDNDLNWIWKN